MKHKIITRKEAISLNKTKYYTGKKCKYGHDSERWTKGSRCVVCNNENNRKAILRRIDKKAGDDLYEKLINGTKTCRLCNVVLNKKSRTKHRPVVDHCHKTNTIRGVICSKCNLALGFFNDDIEVMKRAIKYLLVARLIFDD